MCGKFKNMIQKMPIITKNKNKDSDDGKYIPEDRAYKNNANHIKSEIYNYNYNNETIEIN